MELTISDNAARRIKEIQKEKQIPDDTLLRVGVVSGGCSGLTYELDFDTNTAADKEDKIIEYSGIRICVDMRSFLYLAGTELDYTEGLNGQGFHFKNPNANRTCSCGESFSI